MHHPIVDPRKWARPNSFMCLFCFLFVGKNKSMKIAAQIDKCPSNDYVIKAKIALSRLWFASVMEKCIANKSRQQFFISFVHRCTGICIDHVIIVDAVWAISKECATKMSKKSRGTSICPMFRTRFSMRKLNEQICAFLNSGLWLFHFFSHLPLSLLALRPRKRLLHQNVCNANWIVINLH